MRDGEELPRSLQDNILTLACFSDSACKLVRHAVDPNLFTSSIYRIIITQAYAYIDLYGEAPKDHIIDELEGPLAQENDQAGMLQDVLTAARELSEKINETYVLGQLERFIRGQSLKVGITRAHELVQKGDLDEAEVELARAIKARATVFDPGLTLSQVITTLRSGEDFRDSLATGIKPFDTLGLGPARKELHLFIGPPKRGKSWWLTHITKRALLQRWRGVYVTLELADKFVGKRELQSLFALTSRPGVEDTYTKLVRNDDGALEDIETKKLDRPSVADLDILAGLQKQVDALRFDQDLRIKEFATGSLTVKGLEAYLDNLDRGFNFQPDFVVLDYADLMKLDTKNYRHDLGALYKDLRGLAVDRNLSLITASQSNRSGAGARLMDDTHVAEDYSKIATADCVITYNQTPLERQRRLARLYVASGRVEADRFSVLIAQSYASGQFVLDSQYMREEYWSFLRDPEGGEPAEGEDA